MTSRKSTIRYILAIATISAITSGDACGPNLRERQLEYGGKRLLEAREFYAEIQLKTLALEFPTPFKARRAAAPHHSYEEQDIADFDAALAAGALQTSDPVAARLAHKHMRTFLGQLAGLTKEEAAAIPPDIFENLERQEFPSEFADYHRGAVAYARADHTAARAAWEGLLARPEDQRRYRSVDAAFMIGALACADNLDDAGKWLQLTRDLAQKGFHDTSSLAAATYKREAGWLEGRGLLHEAAEASLRAISAGYPSCECVRPENDLPSNLAPFAADPLLRRIHTALLVAQYSGGEIDEKNTEKLDWWLEALDKIQLKEFAGAEQLGWLCYSMGNYATARGWLAHAGKSAEAFWLAGKLAARAGRREESLRNYSEASRLFAARPQLHFEITVEEPALPPHSTFDGEEGIAAVDAADFPTALASFLRGGHWIDAAYVAERLLTVSELEQFVLRRPWDPHWDETLKNSRDFTVDSKILQTHTICVGSWPEDFPASGDLTKRAHFIQKSNGLNWPPMCKP